MTRSTNPKPKPEDYLLKTGVRLASGLAFLSYVWLLWQLVAPGTLEQKSGWSAALLLIATAIATVLAQSQQLPGLKVLLAALVIGIIGGAAHGIGAATNLPFGPFLFGPRTGPQVFGKLTWAMPWLWIIVILNARGVARLILKPWRKTKTYGFWVIGVTTLLVALLTLALDPLATRGAHYWFWLPTKFPYTWFGMPWSNILGWALTTLLLLAFVTPLLINRSSRSRKLPPDYHPLLVWGLLLILCSLGAGLEKLWLALAFDILVLAISTLFALRGARW